ncbi:MAG: tRNA (adenosine(37)-N6)-dimethylallyltransferase MiaA [Candidatus Daviesbacteria bacterium]|nr:tRNA (adenosine(37)-N6)-dimethylallyltransferase MiaA [Candidatus Daviesbacteria bacterium]
MKKILVILGSTSTGKTDLALRLAKKLNGELVACDSRQVYKKLDIGTGKRPGENGELRIENGKWSFDDIPIHMYDVADPKKQYTVFDYVKDANKAIEGIYKRGKLPVIVGGTGLYLKALLEGLPNLGVPIDPKLRQQLNNLTIKQLQKRLQEILPDKWEDMNYSDRQNPRRLVRAIEIALTPEESLRATVRGGFKNVLKIGLMAPREVLYKRIDNRVVSRINQGMIEEAVKLHDQGLSFERMRQLGLEYGVLADYLEGKITDKEELIRVLQGKIHGYARRQITWFEKEKNVFWIDITQNNWYHDTYDTEN